MFYDISIYNTSVVDIRLIQFEYVSQKSVIAIFAEYLW